MNSAYTRHNPEAATWVHTDRHDAGTKRQASPEAVMVELHKLDKVVQLDVDVCQAADQAVPHIDRHIVAAPKPDPLFFDHAAASFNIPTASPCRGRTFSKK